MENENVFLTRSFIKNQQVSDRPYMPDNNVSMMNTKSLNKIYKELHLLNKTVQDSSKKSFVKKSDPMQQLAKSFKDLKNAFDKSSKVQKAKGLLGALFGVGKFLAIGGIIGYLLFGDKRLMINSLGNLFNFIKKQGSGLLNSILTGDYSGLEKVWNTVKDIGGGLVNFILTGDSSKLIEDYNNFVSKLPKDGLISQLLTGKNKTFNVLKGAIELKGGLLQGLVFGDWDLFNRGLKDVMDNVTWQQAGILGAILFGKPLVAGALSAISKAITTAIISGMTGAVGSAALATSFVTVGLPILATASTFVIGVAAVAGAKAAFDIMDAKKNKEKFINESKDLVNKKYLEKGFSKEDADQMARDRELWIRLGSEDNKLSSQEKINNLRIQAEIIDRQDKIMKKYNGVGSFSYTHSVQDLNKVFGLGQSVTLEGEQSRTDSTLKKVVDSYGDIINEASSKYGVDKNIIAGIIAQESSGNPLAGSNKGAKGLMQMIDSTSDSMGVKNVYDPTQNIMGGTKYFSQQLKRFNGDYSLALAAYNAGPGAVMKAGGIPNYAETQNYVPNVIGNAKRISEITQNNNNIPKMSIPVSEKQNKPIDISSKSTEEIGSVLADKVARSLNLKVAPSTRTIQVR